MKKLLCYPSIFFAALTMLSACSSNKTIEWREETKLSNGQIVVVERKSEYRSVYPGGTGLDWLFQHGSIRAVINGKEIVWEGGIDPMALDVSGIGDVYLVAVIRSSQGQNEYSIPEGKYRAAFKFGSDGNWVRIPVETVPHEVKPNLLIDEETLYISKKESGNVVLELGRKEKLNMENYYSEMHRKWPSE